DGDPAEPAAAGVDAGPSLEDVLAGLPADARAAVLIVDGDGFTTAALAEVLEVPPTKAEALLAAGRAALASVVVGEPGPALAALGTTDHADEFWTELGRRLIAEREAPAAPTFDPFERLAARTGGGPPPVPATGPPGPERGPVPEGSAGPELPLVDGTDVAKLARHADRVRPGPNRRRRLLVAGGIVAAGGLVTVATLIGVSAKPPPRGLAATAIADQVSANLVDTTFLVGHLTVSGDTPSGRTEHYDITYDRDGSVRRRGTDVYADASYDAQLGVVRAVRQTTLKDRVAVDLYEVTGTAVGPPDADGIARLGVDDELHQVIRALRQADTTPSTRTTVDGRPAWVVDLPVTPAAGSPTDRLRIVVDRDQLLPISVTRYAGRRVVRMARFSGLAAASSMPRSTFSLPLPTNRPVSRVDARFQRVSLAGVEKLLGYPAPTPGWLPRGYELRMVAVLPGAGGVLQSTSGGDNPTDRDVVSLGYRRGAEQITITARRDGGPSARWVDPFGTVTDAAAVPKVRLGLGRFYRATAERSAGDVDSSAHVWGRVDGLVFTVSGDLDVTLLTRIAGSLG
ncbi:MAG: hypothetical protein JWM05_1346, partial [Acidimicrobiales bacterium]|nr:hypothetical protein [Acidimicrobiales bacterium]